MFLFTVEETGGVFISGKGCGWSTNPVGIYVLGDWRNCV